MRSARPQRGDWPRPLAREIDSTALQEGGLLPPAAAGRKASPGAPPRSAALGQRTRRRWSHLRTFESWDRQVVERLETHHLEEPHGGAVQLGLAGAAAG